MDTNPIDLDHLRQWLLREAVREDRADPGAAQRMAATVDDVPRALAEGDPLPPLWHWLYFLDAAPRPALGRDGHPARGGFLPPVPLPNRMWAGGQVAWLAPLRLGAPMTRRSRVRSVDAKTGRSGPLVFVTVEHVVESGGEVCLREAHDIVFKEAVRGPAPADEARPPAALRQDWRPDSTELFRYSALTFNGHRIHYDADYCRAVEGYDAPVVHGPLIATRLAGLGERVLGRPLARFEYRARRPVTLGQGVGLCAAAPGADGVLLWAEDGAGATAMQARAA